MEGRNVYFQDFNSWEEVKKQYATDMPEPDKVLYAQYLYEDYLGDSDVAYMNGGKYYLVHGSHCSCNGLEGQWEPTEYATKELFIACLMAMRGTGGMKDFILAAFAEEDKLAAIQYAPLKVRKRLIDTTE